MKNDVTELNSILKRLSEIEMQLEHNIDTTMWISDPHGAGQRFVSILKGRFGLVWRTAYEALPKTFSKEKIEHIDKIIRGEKYISPVGFPLEKQDVISSLVEIIRYKMQSASDFDKIRDGIKSDIKIVLENLIIGFNVPNITYENTIVTEKVITQLSKIVKQVILGQLIVLGDVFDRGQEPDKIIRILANKELKNFVKFVWGNHDILWMGAAAGNPPLIAEALRISCRYETVDFLKRLNIDIEPLKEFAIKTYTKDITKKFKAPSETYQKMEKALAIIQFKLEEQLINRFPQFEMDHRLNLEKLAYALKSGKTEYLNDTDFPTIDLENPLELSKEEEIVIEDLKKQFTKSKPLKRLMKYLFEDGKLYHINNHIFNIHALIPCTADGQFDELMGYSGKKLFDYTQAVIKDIGHRYLHDEKQDDFNLSFTFYLWCGPKSPLFGKDAMKTFERYFHIDKETHKETTLYWEKNLQNEDFIKLIMDEFDSERIVYGHTPVNIEKGGKIASQNGRAINIDGGFSDAYLGRGHALIHTPYSLYAIILPSQDEIEKSEKEKIPAKLKFEEIASFKNPKKIKDSYKGKLLVMEKEELLDKLKTFNIKSIKI